MGVKALPGQASRETAKLNDFMLAQEIEQRVKDGRSIRLTAETAMRLVQAMRWKIAYEGGKQGAYMVESWETERAIRGQLKKSFGTLNNFWAAISAYEGVAEQFPNEHITCRGKARILRQQNEPPTRP
ncbi:hypothetical protein [Flaviflagellibacter deserti]|uniref:Uncharacterized protein n=1 Tax=Flaviflagellibacter deserti TaxID=2267266 RepID=A0ABV9Z2I6_9HYPH